MADSVVAVANRALQKLGASRISAMDQDHPNARTMSACYGPLRRRLIRRYKWGFAIARVEIAADEDETAYGELGRYRIPAECLRILRDNDTRVRRDWKREGEFIISADASPLQLRYLTDVTDPTKWDASFDECLASLMALEACEEITGSSAKKGNLMQEWKDALSDAKQDNAYEEEPVVPLEDDLVLAML
jgi:hypothetical protein